MKILLTGSKGFIGRNIVELLGDKYEIIEVQTGSYLGEDDIVRYENIHNRS